LAYEQICDVTADPSTAPDDVEPGDNCPDLFSVDVAAGESFLDADFCFTFDTTPPVITVPADFEVDAISPLETPVTFTTTATDAVDPNPTIVCNPASGDLFALGDTIVNCTATDNAGNEDSDSFVVTVVVTTSTFDGFIEKIPSMNIHQGTENSLISKINSASDSFENGNSDVAENKLGALINQINAQDGKKLTSVQADLLREYAQALIDNI